MSKKIYSQAEIQALRNNPNVKSVTEKSITTKYLDYLKVLLKKR